MAEDKFAKIAEGYKTATDRGLKPITPPVLPQRNITLESGSRHSFLHYKKMDTKEELYAELKKMREYYKPFMQNFAPETNETEERFELNDFTVSFDGNTPQEIKIPQYGGPEGNHRAVYETSFTLNEFSGKAVYISFKGADYICEVFVNGEFVGNHEGFFAPFEFDITEFAKEGENKLKIVLKNDFRMGDGGDKIYAATGLGWDGAYDGWHHCPAGYGLYNKIFIEIRNKNHITDIFPRVNSGASEIWVECNGEDYGDVPVSFSVSVYGKNFKETVFEDFEFTPSTLIEAGVGDTLTEAQMIKDGILGNGAPLYLGHGFNRFIIPISIENRKIWSSETPWLYEVHVVMKVNGEVVSEKARTFGIRDFSQDLKSNPKGKFYLNGEEIRLRGANTMGYEQQDVLRGDFDRLIDDMLLAKICNMNFLRLTQRPVQEEIYDCCDMLGLMIQTDLPTFGVLRINKYAEALKQAEEMEKLVRSHPCCIVDTYINEPFPNANNMPHRMIDRKTLMNFFSAADDIIHMHNPDRVIKHVDGDYDPPSKLMPDNHCYTMWYNGHGIDMGKLHKGYWLDVMPGWHCGCGEFGAEGLDFCEVMREEYPKEWLKEPFDPNNILKAQTGPFHYFFYETPDSMENWVKESHRYQAFATKIMTSALRRNSYVNTFAIHLFIDAWPSGWMKTIMDCRRNPKPAFFAYRDCLSPVFCSIRSDRFTFFQDENIKLESYVLSDIGRPDEVIYEVTADGKTIYSGRTTETKDDFIGFIEFKAPKTADRTKITVYCAAIKDGEVKHYAQEEFEIWAKEELKPFNQVSYGEYDKNREKYDSEVKNGAKIIIAPTQAGDYKVGDTSYTVSDCQMGALYCVSRDTGHEAVKDFKPNDLRYFYDSELQRLAPIIEATIEGNGITNIVSSANRTDGEWHKTTAIGEVKFGKGKFILNQLLLKNKEMNPAAVKLMNSL